MHTRETLDSALRYFYESLILDNVAKLRFGNNNFINQKHRRISASTHSHFYANLKNKDALASVIKHCLLMNRKYADNEGKPTSEYNAFNIYYTRYLVSDATTQSEQEKEEFFAPFFVKLLNTNNKGDYSEDEKSDLHRMPYYLIRNLYKHRIESTDADIDLFGDSEVNINICLWEEPYSCLSDDFFQEFNRIRSAKGKTCSIETYRHFVEILSDIFSASGKYGNNQEISTKEMISILVQAMEKERMLFNKKKYGNQISFKEGEFIFIVDSNLLAGSDTYNRALFASYKQISTDESLPSTNLLYRYLDGSELAKKAIQMEDADNEKTPNKYSFVDLDKRIALAKTQYGAFDIKNPLTSSQRYCLQMAKSGLDIIPISGPPGTGKTSLLRAFVADYIVENALSIIEQRNNGCKDYEIAFKPPLAAFSSIGQALINIESGITDGYIAARELELFYTRWLNPKAPLNENSTINDMDIYVPFVKGATTKSKSGNKSIGSYHLDFLSAIKNDIFMNAVEYSDSFIGKANQNFNLFDSTLKITDRPYALNKIFYQLAKEISEQIQRISNEIEIQINEKYTAFQNNISLLQKFTTIREDISLQRRIETTLRTKHDMSDMLKYMHEIIDHVQKILDIYSGRIEQIDTDTQNKIDEAKEKNKAQLSELENELKDKIQSLDERYQQNLNPLQAEKNNFESLLKNEEEKRHRCIKEQLTFWGFIVNFLSKKYTMLENQSATNIEKYQAELTTTKDEIAKIQNGHISNINEWTETSENKKTKVSDEHTTFLKSVNAKAEIEKAQAKAKCEDSLKYLSIKSIGDAHSLVLLKNNVEVSYIGDGDLLSEMEKINADLDQNVRLRLFFNSIHIGECALLLKALASNYKFETISCPHCGEHGLNTSKNGNYKHQCGFILNKQYGAKSKGGYKNVDLTDTQAVSLIRDGFFIADGEFYELMFVNEKTQNNYTFKNYIAKFTKELFRTKATLHSISDLLPIFPVLTSTAHSFHSAFGNYDMQTKKKVLQSSFFEYILVDEAGMVLPSLMVNIYAAKKLLLFGDTKQIEPIYPFNNNATIEKVTLDRLNRNNPSNVEKILEDFSLLKHNAMTLGNRSVFIEDRNAIRADQNAPFWLLQHFRCATPIIQFCNKLVYNNMIEPLKKISEDEADRLNKLFGIISGEYKIQTSSPNPVSLYFLNHNENMDLHGNTNKYEADLVAKTVQMCLEAGYSPDKIGVISPFNNQISAIKYAINSLYPKERHADNKLYVGTVHKFQGSERGAIIFSTASGENFVGQSSSLFMNRDNGNMLNVALSRAKEVFFLIGSEKAIANDDKAHSSVLVKHIESNGIKI